MTYRYAQILAASLVAVTVAATWFLSGVEVGDAARFVVFEALYVVLPGCLLCLVLSPDPGGRLRTLAIGWPLGYACEVGAFALCMALGAREAFALLPLISAPLLLALLMRYRSRGGALVHWADVDRHSSGSSPSLAAKESLLGAATISAALILLAITIFTFAPLPGHFQSVVYPENDVYTISLAAEARNHWPMTTPWVAGLPLRYYTAVFMHGAAISQVTGISLSTVYLRLFPTTATLLLAMQLWLLGRSITSSRMGGPIAIVLFFFVGAATLHTTQRWVFEGDSLGTFWGNASFAFSALFLLALLSLMQYWIPPAASLPAGEGKNLPEPSVRKDFGPLVMLGILVLGCAAAKTFAAVDFLGGLGLLWAWLLFTRGRASRLPLRVILVSVIGVGVVYFTMLAGGNDRWFVIRPFNTIFFEVLVIHIRQLGQVFGWYSLPATLLAAAGLIVVTACLSAPVLAALWWLVRRRPLSAFEGLCLAVLLAGIASYYVVLSRGAGPENYFRALGYIPLVIVAAGGLADFWGDMPRETRLAVALACGGLLIVGLVAAGSGYLFAFDLRDEHVWRAAMYAFVASVLVLLVRRLSGAYGSVSASRLGRTLACCIPLMLALGLVRVTANAMFGAKAVVLGETVAHADSPDAYGISAALYRSLAWVREHTRPCDVLAVNNHYSQTTREASAYLYYSAFAERRIFLESWRDTLGGAAGELSFPRRLVLNENAIARGEASALRQLARDGVAYVLVDKTHGGGAREPSRVSRLVYSSSALDVYKLVAAKSPGDLRFGCGERA